MPEEKLRLVLADDHAAVLEEVRRLLAPEFTIARAVSGGRALVEAAIEIRPDVVVSDLLMPDLDGIEAGRRILQRGASGAVLLLTMRDEPDVVRRAIDAGIRGFILKVDAGDELIGAVRTVAAGGMHISRSVRQR